MAIDYRTVIDINLSGTGIIGRRKVPDDGRSDLLALFTGSSANEERVIKIHDLIIQQLAKKDYLVENAGPRPDPAGGFSTAYGNATQKGRKVNMSKVVEEINYILEVFRDVFLSRNDDSFDKAYEDAQQSTLLDWEKEGFGESVTWSPPPTRGWGR